MRTRIWLDAIVVVMLIVEMVLRGSVTSRGRGKCLVGFIQLSTGRNVEYDYSLQKE